jgi:hypothetical protein
MELFSSRNCCLFIFRATMCSFDCIRHSLLTFPCMNQLLKVYKLLENCEVRDCNVYQEEYDSASPTTPLSNPLPSPPISSPTPTSAHTPTPAPTATPPINDMGVVTYEVYLPGTCCGADSSMLHFCGLKESALQSAETDLTMKRLLIGCGGTVAVLDLIDPVAALTTQTPKRAFLAPFSMLDDSLTELSLTEGEQESAQ